MQNEIPKELMTFITDFLEKNGYPPDMEDLPDDLTKLPFAKEVISSFSFNDTSEEGVYEDDRPSMNLPSDINDLSTLKLSPDITSQFDKNEIENNNDGFDVFEYISVTFLSKYDDPAGFLYKDIRYKEINNLPAILRDFIYLHDFIHAILNDNGAGYFTSTHATEIPGLIRAIENINANHLLRLCRSCLCLARNDQWSSIYRFRDDPFFSQFNNCENYSSMDDIDINEDILEEEVYDCLKGYILNNL